MPISRYPRIGQSLAPALLRPILEVPCRRSSGLGKVMGKETLLADLDEKSWDRFDVRTCILLGREIASKVGRSAYTLIKDPTAFRLPRSPVKFSIEQLELEIRTYRGLSALRKKKSLRSPRDWHRLTASDLLELPHFGAKSLVDFLVSYEAMIDPELESVKPRQFTIDIELLQEWLDNPILPVPEQILRSRLPPFPDGTSLESLPLLIRTYNCLQKSGYADSLSSLSDSPIKEILQIRGFGLECFKDLVSALLRTLNKNTTVAPHRQTLEQEFRALISSVTSKRNPNKNIEIVFRFFNLGGNREATMREVGLEHGLTKERIRQICNRTTMLLHRRNQPTPLLDEAVSIVVRQLPRAAEEIEASLAAAGLSSGPYRLEGLIEAAKLFGRDVPFGIDDSAGKRIALASGQLSLAKRVIQTASAAMRRWGACTIFDLAARIEDLDREPISHEVLKPLLACMDGFSWLDREGGWFWLRNARRNRLLTPIRKILSVAGRINIDTLREGVCRHHLMQGFSPPRRVLLELCRQIPGCRVDDGTVVADPPIDWRTELEDVERELARILKEHGPILSRHRFEEIWIGGGMNRLTLHVSLDNSPIIERFDEGRFGLRGTEAQPSTVDSPEDSRNRVPPVRLDGGWTANGQNWIAYQISKGMLASGVCRIASEIGSDLQGEFALRSVEGGSMGTMTVQDGVGRGLSPLFDRRGGEVGDILLLNFDLTSREVRARIGGPELLESPGVPRRNRQRGYR